MAVIVKVSSAFGLNVSEKKTETMQMPIPHGPVTHITINAEGQHYRQTDSFIYLGGAVTETPNLSVEIDRRIRAGWMSFNRYRRELYDRPNASLLDLKVRMVKVDVVQALLYGCGRWTPSRSTTGSSAPYTTGCYSEFSESSAERRTTASCPTPKLSSGPDVRALRPPCARERYSGRGRSSVWTVVGSPTESYLAGWRDRGSAGRGERKRNGRTGWQKTFGLLAMAGTGKLPH